MKSKFDQYYTDLPEGVATKIRDARIKPEQLAKMADGEILSIEGVGDVALEQIREKYPAEIKGKDEEDKTKNTVHPAKPARRSGEPKKIRSARYKSIKSKIKKDQAYSIKEATKLLTSISKPTHSVELHLNTIETGIKGEVKLPHSTGKDLRVAIFNATLENEIKKEELNFDILLAAPADMVKLARYAKLLGPKGLMPNPKNKTVTDNPEKRKKELEQGVTLTYKTEVKFPIIHLNLGSISQDATKLEQNLSSIIRGIGTVKIKSAFLTTTQSPSVKIKLEEE